MLLSHHLGYFGLHHSAGLTGKEPRQEHGRPRRCLPLHPPQATPSLGPAQGHRPCFAVENLAGPSEVKDGNRAITYASRDEGSLGPSSVQAEESWPPRAWQTQGERAPFCGAEKESRAGPGHLGDGGPERPNRGWCGDPGIGISRKSPQPALPQRDTEEVLFPKSGVLGTSGS